MGTLDKGLTFDQDLFNAATDGLNQGWQAGANGHRCRKECNIESHVRLNLEQAGFSLWLETGNDKNTLKGCCKKSKGKSKECMGFLPQHEQWGKGRWVPPSQIKWHPDIVSTKGRTLFIVEIKRVYAEAFMDYLSDKTNTLNHTPPERFHFRLPSGAHHHAPGAVQINSPAGNNPAYYSYLSEGQIWLDISRLYQAQHYFCNTYKPGMFDNIQLYVLLFAVNPINTMRLHLTLNHFSNARGYIYHGGYNKQVFRSPVPNFEYTFLTVDSLKQEPSSMALCRIGNMSGPLNTQAPLK